jgi:hypothetical protein
VVLDAVDLASPGIAPEGKAAARVRLKKTLQAVFCFGAGAIAGAVMYKQVFFWALLLPLALLVWLAASTRGGQPDGTTRAPTAGTVK